MKKYTTLLVTLFAMISLLFFSSCKKDDSTMNNELDSDSVYDIPDPNGTIIANVANNYQTEQYIFSAIPIQIDGVNNFTTPNGWIPGLEIASMGKCEGLGNVTTIPQTGWSSSVAVIPSYGYVVRTPWQESGNIDYENLQYARIYVIDYMTSTSGGIMGCTIKYQAPWTPGN